MFTHKSTTSADLHNTGIELSSLAYFEVYSVQHLLCLLFLSAQSSRHVLKCFNSLFAYGSDLVALTLGLRAQSIITVNDCIINPCLDFFAFVDASVWLLLVW